MMVFQGSILSISKPTESTRCCSLQAHGANRWWYVFCALSSGESRRLLRRALSEVATTDSYPFFTYLERAGHTNCAGTLMWPDIVLSAGHCWEETVSAIIAHVNFTDYNDNSHEHVRFVERVAVHPDFARPSSQYDIMLLKLTSPVFDVQPVILNSVPTQPLSLDRVTVIGAGQIEFQSEARPDKLQQVQIAVVPFDFCNGIESYGGFLNADTQLCAGEEGKDVCQGDSRGPLLMKKERVKVGIVNTGIGCGEFLHPGVYTRTSAFIEWIDFVKCNLTDVPCDGSSVIFSPSSSPTSAFLVKTVRLMSILSPLMMCSLISW